MLPIATVDRLELRIENWVRWCHDSERGGSVCASVEHRYQATYVDTEGFENRHLRPHSDPVDGIRVQQAFIRLQPRHRAFLVLRWLKKREPGAIARRMSLGALAEVDLLEMVVLCALLRELELIERAEVRLVRRGAPIWAGIANHKI